MSNTYTPPPIQLRLKQDFFLADFVRYPGVQLGVHCSQKFLGVADILRIGQVDHIPGKCGLRHCPPLINTDICVPTGSAIRGHPCTR